MSARIQRPLNTTPYLSSIAFGFGRRGSRRLEMGRNESYEANPGSGGALGISRS